MTKIVLIYLALFNAFAFSQFLRSDEVKSNDFLDLGKIKNRQDLVKLIYKEENFINFGIHTDGFIDIWGTFTECLNRNKENEKVFRPIIKAIEDKQFNKAYDLIYELQSQGNKVISLCLKILN